MRDEENRLYETIKDFVYIRNRIADIRLRLAECSYKVTTSYSLTGGCSGGFTSKVENAAIKELRLRGELEALMKEEADVTDALRNGGLTRREYGLVEGMMCGYSLAEYGRMNGLYISHVYKIRDKALRKMAVYLQNRA